MQSPALAVDQERGADLYHHAAEVGEGGGPTGHVKALAADRRHATTIVAPVRCLACAFGSAPRRNSMRKAFIGTSGWTYADWRGRFYPEDLRNSDRLAWYATQFPTTEINGSFYRTPSLDAVRTWRDQTPKDFLFTWKASKFITHWKRLDETCPNSIALMETRLKALSPKVGAVLFQLPPQFSKNRERLASFSTCCRAVTASPSSSVTRAGTTTICSISCTNMTYRFVCPTITTRPRPG